MKYENSANQEHKLYSWQESIREHLADVSLMSQDEYEQWLNFSILGIKMKEILGIREQSPLDSIEGTDKLMQLLFERAGDYDNLLPYGADAFLKLSEDEQLWFTEKSNLIKEQFNHALFRHSGVR